MEAMSRNRAILERYYSALQHKDADELRSSIEEGFAPDAVLRISDSLPYGGMHAGREAILTMLTEFVTTTTPIIRPEQIMIERMGRGRRLHRGQGGLPVAAWIAARHAAVSQ